MGIRDDKLWDDLLWQLKHPLTPDQEERRRKAEETFIERKLNKVFGGALTGGAAPIKGYVRYDKNPYEEIQKDKTLSTDEKVKRIKAISEAEKKKIDQEHALKMAKLYGGAGLEIGSAAVPGMLGGKVASTAFKLSKPLIQQIAKKELTKGVIEGALSGAVGGLGQGIREDKNLLKSTVSRAIAGGVEGGALGKISGEVLKRTPRVKELDEVLDKRQDWGIAYRKQSGKPAEAIDKLIKEKQGFVPKAFHKDGIGDVDLVWGKQDYQTGQGYGLEHIIDGRTRKNKVEGIEFVKNLPETMENGVITRSAKHPGNVYIEDVNNKIAIPQDYYGKPRNWVITAHPQNKSASKRLATFAPKLSKPHSGSRSNNFTAELTADSSIIPHSERSFNPALDIFEWVKRRRGIK